MLDPSQSQHRGNFGCNSSKEFLKLIVCTNRELWFVPVWVIICMDTNPSAAFAALGCSTAEKVSGLQLTEQASDRMSSCFRSWPDTTGEASNVCHISGMTADREGIGLL